MTDEDRFEIMAAFCLTHGAALGLKADAIEPMAKKLLASKNYSFNGDRFIPNFAMTQLIEESLDPASAHLFKQHKADNAAVPAAEKPKTEQLYGMDRAAFLALPASRRLEIHNAAELEKRTTAAATEERVRSTLLIDSLPAGFENWSAQDRLAYAYRVEPKIAAARRRTLSDE